MNTCIRTRPSRLAAAILTSFAALGGAAHADTVVSTGTVATTIYGFINGQVESVEAFGGATPYERRGRISDGNSRIGFSGAIAINPHTKGIWQIEGGLNNFEQGGVNDDGKSATLESRNTFVGMEDDRLGRLVVGNNDSIYRSLVGSGGALGGNLGMTVHGVDVWNNTSAQMTGNGDSIFSRGEARYKNSIHYLSPLAYGFQGGASYGFDETQSNRSDRARYSVALKYSIGSFSVGAGYDRQENTGVNLDRLEQGLGFSTTTSDGVNTSYAKVVGLYQFPTKTTLGLGYEVGKFGFSSVATPTAGEFYTGQRNGDMKQHSAMVSLAQDVGDAAFLFSYAKLGNLSNTTYARESDFSASQFSVGATYNLDPRFTPYVYFTKIRNKAQGNINLGQSPLRSNNSGSDNAFLAPGDSPRAIGFGLLARF